MKNQERRAEGGGKKSPGPVLIKSFRGLRAALRNGEDLGERFTMRTMVLNLEPREYTADEVMNLRERLKASQGVFAKLLGVSIKTLQAWEQGANPPSPIARRLLQTIETDPQPWERMLRNAAAVSA